MASLPQAGWFWLRTARVTDGVIHGWVTVCTSWHDCQMGVLSWDRRRQDWGYDGMCIGE